MALFQRKPQTSDPKTFYSIGLNKMVLLVGLGNPGSEYASTRHNVGYICLDAFVQANPAMSDWIQKNDLKCQFSSGKIGETRVIAIKPTTYMNLSGESVRAAADFYKIHPDKILVVHDELDIDYGFIRLRVGGASAGHNGIKSVTHHLGPDYGRMRVGIGPKSPPRINSEDYVLQRFSDLQAAQLPNLIKEATAILSEYVHGNELAHETRSFLV